MLDRELQHEYALTRKYIQKQNKSLSKKGLKTLDMPKVRELKDTRQLKRELKKAEKWRTSGRSTIKGSQAYEEEKKRQRQETRKRKNEKRREQRREEWIEEQPERKQWFIGYMEDKGLKIQNETEFKQWVSYVNKRKAMQSRKDKYEMEKFVDEYHRLEEKSGGSKSIRNILKDFESFLTDQDGLKRRMRKMKFRYDKSLIDQLYSNILEW